MAPGPPWKPQGPVGMPNAVARAKRKGLRGGICTIFDFCPNCVDMQGKTDDAGTHAGQIGLEVNVPKTKHMRMNNRSTEPIQMYGLPIEEVEEFPYLGSKMTSDGSCNAEIRTRLANANQAFIMWNVWKAGKLNLQTKNVEFMYTKDTHPLTPYP